VTVIRWQQAAALLLTFVFALLLGGIAAADTARISAGAAPVLYVQMREGTVTIRSGNQPQVQIDYGEGVTVDHVGAAEVARRLPAEIMLWSQVISTPEGDLQLPPETFVLPDLNDGSHDAIVVHGDGNATIVIPAVTALIITNVRHGTVSIEGYKNGVFVAHVAAGGVTINNVSGTGAIQVNDGRVLARNSDFTRLRVRTARGNVRFEDCTASEIEATSLAGSIIYDNGTFRPGLARFESQLGDVVLGVSGDSVVSAHSSAGKIFSDAGSISAGSTDAQAVMGRGGPVVTATSGTGSVIFYRGALRNHPKLRHHFSMHKPPALEQKFPHNRHIHLKRMLR
jgi:hypothetical protein